MAKTKIPISEGERLSKKYKAPIVIVFTILDNGNTFNVLTFGASKPLCKHAADLGKKIADKVLNGEIVPSQEEPIDIPNVPTNWESIEKPHDRV